MHKQWRRRKEEFISLSATGEGERKTSETIYLRVRSREKIRGAYDVNVCSFCDSIDGQTNMRVSVHAYVLERHEYDVRKVRLKIIRVKG